MAKLNILPDNPEVSKPQAAVGSGRFPKWLHRKMPTTNMLWETQEILGTHRLPTVCEEAKCPNLLECWSKKTATFLAMGKECTRNCGFCDIDFSKTPKPLEEDEPKRLANSVKSLGLKHVVITMVARDDLPDQGAFHLTQIIQEVRLVNPQVTIEVLTSDFNGNLEALQTLLDSRPEIFNHNIETVRTLTPRVRHRATYERSLSILHFAKQQAPSIHVKSGMMLGLGESEQEVKETLQDLHRVGCDIVTMGQYLQPSSHKLRVKEFVTPEQFEAYSVFGNTIGIKYMHAGPFVRSSYNASSLFEKIKQDQL